MRITKTQAISMLLSKEVMIRESNGDWSFVVNDFCIGTINKNVGKYFAHYRNRNTPLVGCDHFMQAVAKIVDAFIEYYNKLNTIINDGTLLYLENGWTAVVGSDDMLYINHESEKLYRNFSVKDERRSPGKIQDAYNSIDQAYWVGIEIYQAYETLFVYCKRNIA